MSIFTAILQLVILYLSGINGSPVLLCLLNLYHPPISHLPSRYSVSVFNISVVYLLIIWCLPSIQLASIFHLSILYLLAIHYLSWRYPICLLPILHHITALHLSSIYHQFFSYPDFTILLFILQVSSEYFPCIIYPQALPVSIFLLLFLPICHLSYRYSTHLSSIYLLSHIQIYYIFQLSVIYPLIILSIPSIYQ